MLPALVSHSKPGVSSSKLKNAKEEATINNYQVSNKISNWRKLICLLFGNGTDVNALLLAHRLELVGNGAIVAEQAVARRGQTHNAGQHLARVYADAHANLLAAVVDVVGRRLHHEQRHERHLLGVCGARLVQAAGGYVRVADRLDLVDVEQAAIVVEVRIQSLEHLDDLDRLRHAANRSESHYVSSNQLYTNGFCCVFLFLSLISFQLALTSRAE